MNDQVRVLVNVPELRDDETHLREIADVSPRVSVDLKIYKTNDETAEALEGVEVLYTQRPPTHLDRADRLRWVQFSFTGVDNKVDNPLFDPGRDIVVTNGAGAHAIPIAEYCLAAMGMLTRDFMRFFRDQQNGVRDRSHSGQLDLFGKTLVIVGYGHIGREVARLASAHRMRILAVDRDRAAHGFQWDDMGDPGGSLPQRFLDPSQLDEALAEADYVVSCVPLTPLTRDMFNDEAFATMKPGAFFVHVGRGGTLDDLALARALDGGRIAGAAVDVFKTDPNPLPPDHPLWTNEKCFMTPHVSGNRNPEYFRRMSDIFCGNLRRYLKGEPLLNVVTRERGY